MNAFAPLAGYILAAMMALAGLFSWFLLLGGNFRPYMLLPEKAGLNISQSKRWFAVQAALLIVAAVLVFLRVKQLQHGHRDNVMDNITFGISSLLFFRVLGDFKHLGVFAPRTDDPFSRLDKKALSPLFLFWFALSVFLLF
ncbi:MAG TPA: DUF3995 domain-containing protein [Bacteroidales bacterium]|nr:DUF3995 domain-containing protein [Bacteroidales bacterium]